MKPSKYTNTVEGWTSDEELNWLFQRGKKYRKIVEIGSWKGRSARAILDGLNGKGKLTCVDTFMGSDDDEIEKKQAKEVNVFTEFWRNCGSASNLRVLMTTSDEANGLMYISNEFFDMTFIDASHSYESIKQDIELWLPRTKKIICGHDYHSHAPGVLQATKELLGEVEVIDTIWYKTL